MNKVDLVEIIALEARLTKKDATAAIEATLEAIASCLAQGEEVKLSGFGVFTVKEKAARKGVNPSSGEEIIIPATKAVSFKPSKGLKDRVN
jgi:nucleoid DNA-binding protein